MLVLRGPMMQTRVLHHLKIGVVKFDMMNNFGMWKVEVPEDLVSQNLEYMIELKSMS